MTHRVGPPIGVLQLQVGLLLHAIQVFVQPVQQEGEQLLGVLLLVARKLRGEAAHLGLQQSKGIGRQKTYESGKSDRKLS